jgi:DNA-directed RNA polymerase subunit RPC12/RpoP
MSKHPSYPSLEKCMECGSENIKRTPNNADYVCLECNAVMFYTGEPIIIPTWWQKIVSFVKGIICNQRGKE